MIFLDNDVYQGRMLDEYGEYSEEEVDLFRRIVRPNDIVIEAGANIGTLTIPLARMVRPAGGVLAFEAQRALFYLLCGNVALNGLHKTACPILNALGAAEGMINVPSLDYTAEVNFGGLSLGGTDGEPQLVTTIDAVRGLRPIRLIKADVEGMEAEVLAGARETIARDYPFLYVENDREENSARLLGMMADFGYRLYRHQPRYLPAGNTLFPNMVSLNVLGVPLGSEFVVPSSLSPI